MRVLTWGTVATVRRESLEWREVCRIGIGMEPWWAFRERGGLPKALRRRLYISDFLIGIP